MSTSETTDPATGIGRLRVLLVVAAALPCLGYLASELFFLDGDLGFPLDDSWIHLAFARNLAEGQGLVYNGARLVAGSTAPLWTALLSVVFLLPGSPILWTKLLGMAFHLGTVDASFLLARELRVSRGLSFLAAGWTGTASWLVWSSLSGMEVPLFSFLTVWGLLLHAREVGSREKERFGLSPLVLSLSALARPEGLLLLVLAAVDRVVGYGDGRWLFRPEAARRVVRLALFALLLVAPVALFNVAVGGSPLPTTFETKAGVSGGGGSVRLQYLYLVFGIFFQAQPIAALLAAGGGVALLSRLGSDEDRGLLPLLWVVGLPLAYAFLTPANKPLLGNFGRYFFPLLPVVSVLGVVSLSFLASSWPGRISLGGRSFSLSLLVATALLVPGCLRMFSGAGLFVQSVANVADSDVAMARWLESRVDSRAVLAVNDIGAMGYFLDNPLLDLAGIVTPEVHDYARRSLEEHGDWQPGVLSFLEERQPDFVVVFPEWLPSLSEEPGFLPVHRQRIPNNITMGAALEGGSELLLYETPWTRYPLR